MPNRKRRGNLLFPLILVFLGVLFLLINLDVVDSSIWSKLAQYWPVLLIIVGIDMLLRRPSVGVVIGAVIGIILIIAVISTLFLAPAPWSIRRQTFTHHLGRATAAEIVLSCRNCSMNIGPPSQRPDFENLISGKVNLRHYERLTESLSRNGDKIRFRLASDYRFPFPLSARHEANVWNVSLSEAIPISLLIETNGSVELDLTGIILESADISTGNASSTIRLPSTSAALYLSGHRIILKVPDGVGVRIQGSAAMEVAVPTDYIRNRDIVLSPNYETAAHQIDIILRPGSEWVEVLPLDATPLPES